MVQTIPFPWSDRPVWTRRLAIACAKPRIGIAKPSGSSRKRPSQGETKLSPHESTNGTTGIGAGALQPNAAEEEGRDRPGAQPFPPAAPPAVHERDGRGREDGGHTMGLIGRLADGEPAPSCPASAERTVTPGLSRAAIQSAISTRLSRRTATYWPQLMEPFAGARKEQCSSTEVGRPHKR